MNELSYYEPYISNNIIYSCDMIRLKFVFQSCYDDSLKRTMIPGDFMFHMICKYDFKSEKYNSDRLSSYKELVVFHKGDCTISVGFFHNQADGSGYHHNFIEFNPNKADMRAVYYLLQEFAKYSIFLKNNTFYEVVRYDLAVDIPISRQYVKLLKNGKRKHTRIEEKGSVTEYSGKRNTNGFVKVYDKTLESGLYYDLTRIEITCDSSTPTLPEIHLQQYQTSIDFDFELNRTDKVLCELIRRCDMDEMDYWFRQLGKSKQQKLKEYIFSDKDMFQFDRLGILHVISVVEDIAALSIIQKEELLNDKINQQRIVSGKQYNPVASESAPDWTALIPDDRSEFNDIDIIDGTDR